LDWNWRSEQPGRWITHGAEINRDENPDWGAFVLRTPFNLQLPPQTGWMTDLSQSQIRSAAPPNIENDIK
jgi:hypothetical protein